MSVRVSAAIPPSLLFAAPSIPAETPSDAKQGAGNGDRRHIDRPQRLVLASKTLAATMVDLYEKSATLAEIRDEFAKAKGNVAFKAYVPDGPPPVPMEKAAAGP